jgi:hypothetical protein
MKMKTVETSIRVLVTGSRLSTYWYAKHIGEVFNVKRMTQKLYDDYEIDQDESPLPEYVTFDLGKEFPKFIHADDCRKIIVRLQRHGNRYRIMTSIAGIKGYTLLKPKADAKKLIPTCVRVAVQEYNKQKAKHHV